MKRPDEDPAKLAAEPAVVQPQPEVIAVEPQPEEIAGLAELRAKLSAPPPPAPELSPEEKAKRRAKARWDGQPDPTPTVQFPPGWSVGPGNTLRWS